MDSITLCAECICPATPQAAYAQVFDLAGFPEISPPGKLAPPVVRIEWTSGALGPAQGAQRLVFLADGSCLIETVLTYDEPRGQRYLVEGFRPPLSWLVRRAEGEWRFTPAATAATSGQGTEVRWLYYFEPRNSLAALLLRPLLSLIFQPMMNACVERLRAKLAGGG
jgi:hypothetical protein